MVRRGKPLSGSSSRKWRSGRRRSTTSNSSRTPLSGTGRRDSTLSGASTSSWVAKPPPRPSATGSGRRWRSTALTRSIAPPTHSPYRGGSAPAATPPSPGEVPNEDRDGEGVGVSPQEQGCGCDSPHRRPNPEGRARQGGTMEWLLAVGAQENGLLAPPRHHHLPGEGGEAMSANPAKCPNCAINGEVNCPDHTSVAALKRPAEVVSDSPPPHEERRPVNYIIYEKGKGFIVSQSTIGTSYSMSPFNSKVFNLDEATALKETKPERIYILTFVR